MPVTYELYKIIKITFKVFDQGERLTNWPGDIGGGGVMKKVTNGDTGRRGSKIWHFGGEVIFELTLSVMVRYDKAA